MKVALVTGITGQDGTYLARHLIDEGYRVIHVLDPLRDSNIWGLDYLGILSNVTLTRVNLHDFIDCQRLLSKRNPMRFIISRLKAVSRRSFREPAMTMRVNTQPVINLLEAIRTLNTDSVLSCIQQ